MDEARKARFEQLLNDTREDIRQIEEQIEKELAAIKQRLAGLQNEKEAQMVVYDGYCRLLGVENDLAAEEEDDDELED